MLPYMEQNSNDNQNTSQPDKPRVRMKPATSATLKPRNTNAADRTQYPQAAIDQSDTTLLGKFARFGKAILPPKSVMKYAFVAAATASATIPFTLHYLNNEANVINNTLHEGETKIHALQDGSTLILKGDAGTIIYKGISCNILLNLPTETDINLGNTSDASLNPLGNDASMQTLLGSLGITRNVKITKSPAADAEALMQSFYNYAQECNENMRELIQSDQNLEPTFSAPQAEPAPQPGV